MRRAQNSPKVLISAVKAALRRAGLQVSQTTGSYSPYGHSTRVTTQGYAVWRNGYANEVLVGWREGNEPYSATVSHARLVTAHATLLRDGFAVEPFTTGHLYLTLRTTRGNTGEVQS